MKRKERKEGTEISTLYFLPWLGVQIHFAIPRRSSILKVIQKKTKKYKKKTTNNWLTLYLNSLFAPNDNSSMPSAYGSYLAAATLFSTLTQSSVSGSTFLPNGNATPKRSRREVSRSSRELKQNTRQKKGREVKRGEPKERRSGRE